MLCPRCGHEEEATYRYCPECWLEVNPTGEEADFRVGLMRGDWERRHPERVAEYEA